MLGKLLEAANKGPQNRSRFTALCFRYLSLPLQEFRPGFAVEAARIATVVILG